MKIEQMQPEWLQLLQANPSWLFAITLMMLCLGAFLLRTQRSQRATTQQPRKHEQPELQKLVVAQASALKLMSERVAALENYLELMGDKQQMIVQSIKPKRTYRAAIDGADAGANDEEIMKKYGLARPEAKLVAAVYGNRAA